MKRIAPKPDHAAAFSYLRFSSPEQAKGDSTRRQTAMRDAWLKKTGVPLDPLTFRDAGVSGYTGTHRENPDRHALAAFLEAIRTGRVPSGSFLIIENLDRLTREDTVPALHLFTGILTSGVRIVQLDPESIYTDKSEFPEVMRAILELSRGNSESRSKSRRLTHVWGEKKRQARAGGVISRACPAWMEVRGGKYTLTPDRAATVRRIFRMATDGLGARAITRQLIDEKVKPIARREWNPSYVRLILMSPAAYGEYQPMTGSGAGRKPDGAAIPGFYPAVVTADEFHAARGAKKKRTAGRPAKFGVNIFTGLAKDARTSSPIHMHTYRHGGRDYPCLLSYHGAVSFPLKAFEAAVFSCLREIDPREVLTDDASGDVVLSLAGRLADLDGRLDQIRAALLTDGDVATLVDVSRTLEADRQAVTRALNDARRESSSPVAEAWGTCRSLLDALGSNTARTKLRSAFRRIVDGVWCVFEGTRKGKAAAVQIRFTGGHHRDYLILYKPEHIGFGARRRAKFHVTDLPLPGRVGELDFRVKGSAAAVAKWIAAIDVNAVETGWRDVEPEAILAALDVKGMG